MGGKIHLQPDDVKFIRLLGGTFLLLDEAQAAELFGHRSSDWFRRRLKKLARDQWVNVREPDDERKVRFFYLGRRGQELLDPDSRNVKIQGRIKQARKFSEGELPHLRFVNSVHIKFGAAGRDYKDYELVSWIPQYAALWRALNADGLPVRPDGYAHYRKSGRDFHTFIEADRGSYRGEPVRKKLEGYWRYAASGRSVDHFSTSGFRVLFVTKSARRAKELIRAMSSYPSELFWVSVREEFLSQPLFHPHWQEHSSRVARSLDEPVEPLPEPPETPKSGIVDIG